MRLSCCLLLVAFLAPVVVLHSQAQECGPEAISVPPKQPFNPLLIYFKWWYVQEIFYRREEEILAPSGDCVTQHLQSSVIGLDLMEDYTNSAGEFERDAMLVSTLQPLSVWSVHQSWFVNGYVATWTHTDYVHYGVMHYCVADKNNVEVPFERVLVLTGSAERNETLMEELQGMVAGLGFPVEHSVRVKHSDVANCTYCADSECPVYDDAETESNNEAGVVLDFEEE